ncbi:thioredoxin family protein [Rosettibacter firmus]|uniref:thioredoxin family protein n=1 Tax=Rosettibacter firmus TaxID=3111522 RepID=UPI00336C0E19
MIRIKILGPGCKKCQTLESKVKEIVNKEGIEAIIEKVTDISEIMNYGIMMTPGLVINDQVKCFGIIPKEEQIISWLKEGYQK